MQKRAGGRAAAVQRAGAARWRARRERNRRESAERPRPHAPEAAPRYSTLAPGLMWMLSTPARMEAASLERKGFHTRYSICRSEGQGFYGGL